MMPSKLIEQKHFATQRFDRLNGLKKHILTASGLTGWDFQRPNDSSYENLFELAEMAVGKIDLMPGGGLREETFEEVLHPLIRHYHLSGRKLVKSPSNASLFEMHRMETDAQTIAHVVQKVKAFFDK